jgi:1,4-dihydroxy-2-naphthoyl-CoA synthase
LSSSALESFRCSTIIRVQQMDVGLATAFRSIQKEVPVIPKMTSVLLILVLVAISSSSLVAQQESQQSVSEMRRVANAAAEKDKQVNVVLRAKSGGKKKVSGVPSQVSEQVFNLTDSKSGRVSRLHFEDVREIRIKPSHVWLLVGIGVAAGLVIAVLVGLHSAASNS